MHLQSCLHVYVLFTYDFYTLYTTLPQHLIKDEFIDLIERTFSREHSLYSACKAERAVFTSDEYKIENYDLAKMFVKPLFNFWIIFY